MAPEFRRDICFPRNRFLSESQGSVVSAVGVGLALAERWLLTALLLLSSLLPVCRQLLQHPPTSSVSPWA